MHGHKNHGSANHGSAMAQLMSLADCTETCCRLFCPGGGAKQRRWATVCHTDNDDEISRGVTAHSLA